MKSRRIGIYAGSFNPVHAGHIAFALQALAEARLDAVYFLPERQPRNKPGAEHMAHRAGMLIRATRPYRTFHVLELEDINFSVERTLPRLHKRFPDDQLFLLCGNDVALTIPGWHLSERLLKQVGLVVGMRTGNHAGALERELKKWPTQPRELVVMNSPAPTVSSSAIREAIGKREYARGLLKSVQRYCSRHWLYVSLASSSSER